MGVDQVAARRDYHVAQKGQRRDRAHQSVREIDPALSRRDLRDDSLSRARETFGEVPDIPKCPFAQIGELQVIAQQVVAVELDERVQIEERLHPRQRHHQKGGVVDPRVHVRHPPRDRSEGPEDQLDAGSGDTDAEPLRLLGEEPRVADVGIERGSEVDQQESEVVHLTAEAFTGQPVRELVGRRETEADEEEQRNRGEPVQPGQVSPDVGPADDTEGRRENDEGRRHDQEWRREAEPHAPNETVEETVRIEEAEAEVQQGAAHPTGRPRAAVLSLAFALQEPALRETAHEPGEGFGREPRCETGFGARADDVERSFAVELLGDELLELTETKEPAGAPVLDDTARPINRLLPADREIAPEFWRRCEHADAPGRPRATIPAAFRYGTMLRATALGTLALGALRARRARAVAAARRT